jgi:hypothetical protein
MAAPTCLTRIAARTATAWTFVRAYVLLRRARRLIAAGGLQQVERSMLSGAAWGRRGPGATHATLRRIERAVNDACRWQLETTNCFPRAVATYTLLRDAGAEPSLRIGVRARPFAGHAWVEVNGDAVADSLTSGERATLRVMRVIDARRT